VKSLVRRMKRIPELRRFIPVELRDGSEDGEYNDEDIMVEEDDDEDYDEEKDFEADYEDLN
jgi:hypothetical protein